MTIHRIDFSGAYLSTFHGRGIGIAFPWAKLDPYRPADIDWFGFRVWYR